MSEPEMRRGDSKPKMTCRFVLVTVGDKCAAAALLAVSWRRPGRGAAVLMATLYTAQDGPHPKLEMVDDARRCPVLQGPECSN